MMVIPATMSGSNTTTEAACMPIASPVIVYNKRDISLKQESSQHLVGRHPM